LQYRFDIGINNPCLVHSASTLKPLAEIFTDALYLWKNSSTTKYQITTQCVDSFGWATRIIFGFRISIPKSSLLGDEPSVQLLECKKLADSNN